MWSESLLTLWVAPAVPVYAVSDRNAYVNALEKASVGEDIVPFADFLAGLVQKRLAGEPLPAVPRSSS